ncbi:hypothetical protein GCM10007161_03770 [Ignatzschineria indica]|uniref:Restriction endonuclease subunit S n=1 Tax=Ignatzschineria indica TaxID=472583 RepID=A0A2U2AMI8_9GAMM|nr:restriction endonuclease subunit S [Ignatzschineria indica]PWD84378.1 restriction endonuclease subunit S [Ignatzschineria indica]GGZ75996.1 hypothetical protein GCM10007161_03770 [Ignatzschineria indica]
MKNEQKQTILAGKVPAGYQQTEVGIIPEDWEVVKLGDLGSSIIGLTYSPQDVKDFGTLVLRSSNIQNNRLAYKDNVYVNAEIPNRVIVKENDILICVRNGSRSLIGKCALIDKNAEGMAFGAFMSVFRSNSSSFVFYQFQSSLVHNQINEIMGATINQITNKDLERFIISIPTSKAEQTAIAEALSDVDSLLVSLEKLIEKKRAIKTGTMQQLLTGKKRLPAFAQREDGTLKGYKITELGEIPEDWEVKLLLDLSSFKNGIAHEDTVDESGEYILINSKFISTEGQVIKFTSENRQPVFKDDILMVMSDVPNGRAIAKCYLVDENDRYTLNQRICALTAKNIVPKYLFYILNRNKYYLAFDDGAKQTNLRREDVLNCPLIIPPLKEQTAIAEILSDMDAEIEALEAKRTKTEKIKQGMMQELLTGRTRLI